MEITRDLVLPGPPERSYGFVDDLQQYPSWMTLIHEVVPAPPSAGDPPGSSAWTVELRAQIGPLARSKQLRMVRTIHEPPAAVRFERIEVDGRSHAPWRLDVRLDADAGGPSPVTRLTMSLAYGGRLWTGAVLQRVLDDYVTHGSEALIELVTTTG